MLCVRCNEKQATIHYTEIIDGKVKKLDLCADCAEAIGIGDTGIIENNSLSGFFSGMLETEKHEVVTNKCPVCGLNYEDFKRSGRLGCSSCYDAFGDGLKRLIYTVHKNNKHRGKVPIAQKGQASQKNLLHEYSEELEKAIREERFEDAAELRDKIKQLKEEK